MVGMIGSDGFLLEIKNEGEAFAVSESTWYGRKLLWVLMRIY